MTSAIPVKRSTNLANKPTGSWELFRSYLQLLVSVVFLAADLLISCKVQFQPFFKSSVLDNNALFVRFSQRSVTKFPPLVLSLYGFSLLKKGK